MYMYMHILLVYAYNIHVCRCTCTDILYNIYHYGLRVNSLAAQVLERVAKSNTAVHTENILLVALRTVQRCSKLC